MTIEYKEEPRGQKSRRFYFQAAAAYAEYLKTGYLAKLFKAAGHYENARKIDADHGAQYVAAACVAYSINQKQFENAMIDGRPE